MFFKTKEGKAEILDLYNQKLNELTIDYSEKLIETKFGKTNILVVGDVTLPPLLLIHGTGGCAPLILESFSELHKHYCVYAVDVLAQPNKSDENLLNMKTLEYGKWLTDIIIKLRLKEVTLVGFSFGGLISLKSLLFNQTSIKKAYLIAPVFIVNGNPFLSLFKMFIPIKKYIKSHDITQMKKVMKVLFTEYDEFGLQFLAKTFQHCNMDFSPLPVISKKEAKNIHTPIAIFACEKDLLFPGKKMIKKAKSIFSSLDEVILLKDTKHVPSAKDFLAIQERIIENVNNVSSM